jgi:DNA-binding XRE family transcriptional regulator
MTDKPGLDFSKVEALRKHLMLTTADMAKLLGVSRMTYYGWVKGKAMRKTNDVMVRSMLRKLLAVITEQGWPSPEVIAMESSQRLQRLRETLGVEEEPQQEPEVETTDN